MKITQNRIQFIVLFITMIIFILTSCSFSTEPSKGTLTGSVNLEEETDHSDITIALYDLVIFNTDIVSVNQEYPQIGVHINQHTEFDHRFQTPVKYTETLTDGSFELKKISTGKYNLVMIKDGWGFKYLYEIEISKGDNDLDQQIVLFEEQHISGGWSENVIVDTDHHLIIDEDTDLVPGTILSIQPGAVIRINPGSDLTIYGTLVAQGEENNMFWITSNDGFNESLVEHDSLSGYGSIRLPSIASVDSDLIEWGKLDWASIPLSASTSNTNFENLIINNCYNGPYIADCNNIKVNNIVTDNFGNLSQGGLVLENIDQLIIEKNILINNLSGIYAIFCTEVMIKNNYIANNENGLYTITNTGNIENNEFAENDFADIRMVSNTYQGELQLKYNNFNSDYGLWQLIQGSFHYMDILIANYNNFHCSDVFIRYASSSFVHEIDIDATNNYFNNAYTADEILEKIEDTDASTPQELVDIIIDNFHITPITSAGIQN